MQLRNLSAIEVAECTEECLKEYKRIEKECDADLLQIEAVNLNLLIQLFDIYIDHRIKQDKVIESILKDIQANTQQFANASSLSEKILNSEKARELFGLN
jgi:hypothetical protein